VEVRGFTSLRGLGVDRSGALIEARADASGELVVIRILTPALTADAVAMREMRRDMATLQRLRHSNLVSVIAFDTRAGAVISESVHATSLRRVVDVSGPLDLAAAMVVLDDCLAGLEALHGAHLFHRDVRPDAVLIAMSGAVLLRDAGVPVPALRAGWRAGTPQYMAPELWAGRAHSSATDLYAATAVFFEAVTGEVPYTANELAALAYQHERVPVPESSVPLAARRLVATGLAKDPRDRPSSATHFRSELEATATGFLGGDWRPRGRAWLQGAALARADDPLPAEPVLLPDLDELDERPPVLAPEPPLRLGPGWRVWAAVSVAVVTLLIVIVAVAHALTTSPDQTSPSSSGQPLFTTSPSVDATTQPSAPASGSPSDTPSFSPTPTPKPTQGTPLTTNSDTISLQPTPTPTPTPSPSASPSASASASLCVPIPTPCPTHH
jgi:eukaryotic-like serine/threonine-protein kinase